MNIAQSRMKPLYLGDYSIDHRHLAMAKMTDEICKGGSMDNQAGRLIAAVLILVGLFFTTGCSDMVWGGSGGKAPTSAPTQAKGLDLKLDAEQVAQTESSVKSYQAQASALQKTASENQSSVDTASQQLNQLNVEVAQLETERQALQAAMPSLAAEVATLKKELSPLQNLLAAKKDVSELSQKVAKLSGFDLLIDMYRGNTGELAKLEKARAYVKANSWPAQIADDVEALSVILNKEQSLKEAEQRLAANTKRAEAAALGLQVAQTKISKQQQAKALAERGFESAKAQLSKVGNPYDNQYKANALNLFQEYSRASAVETKKVISVIQDLHLRAASLESNSADLGSVVALIQKVSDTAALSAAATPGEFKLAVDAAVGRHGHEGAVSNYSGTTLFLVLNEMRQNPIKDMVVIFVKGHTLPGYIQMEGGRHVLRGIEMNADGKAVVDFGFTAQLAGDIRVVDANQYLLVEALRPLGIANLSDVYQQMSLTTKKWDFTANSTQGLDPAPLSFGSSEVKSGGAVRPSFDLMRYAD